MSQSETIHNDVVMCTAEEAVVASGNSADCPDCANAPASDANYCPKSQKPRRTSSQVEPESYPDCRASDQLRYAVKGALYSPVFDCEWDTCRFHVCRAGCESGETYHRRVYGHLESHAANPPASVTYCCKWRSCPGAPEKTPQHKRNRVRHLTTHLRWYILCLQCAALHARLDVNGSKDCAAGKCAAKDEKIRKGLEVAKARFGGPVDDVVLSEFISVVINPEKTQ